MSELIIQGSRPTKNFTIVPNQVLNTLPISSTAKIIIAHLMSKPKGWHTNLESLYKHCAYDSKNAVRKAVGKLQKLGFLTLETLRTGKLFSGCKWFLNLDYILTFPPSDSTYWIPIDENTNTSTDNKTDPIKTDFNKTDSAPENPPPEISEPISLDLDPSVIPEPVAPKAANSLLSRLESLKAKTAASSGYQAALKKREQTEAAFQAILQQGQNFQQQATQALTAAYAHLTPAQTVETLCREHIANPKPRLDAPNRAKLTSWLQNGGGLLPLIEAFKQAQRAQSKTAKYVVKILAT